VEATSIPHQADEESGADELRVHLHHMWGSVAGGWEEHATWADARGSGVTEKMLELANPQPGDRVLELACGPGGVGLAAAERVAPDGEVVVSDVAPEMTSIAAARAEVLGLTNVSSRELDLERIDEPDGSYDVVLCREGLMLVPDPARAAGEIRRVLRPGGRVALAVWGPRERNPWLGIVFDAVSAQFGVPMPPPGIPGPFSLEDADRLAALLSTAGLVNVEVLELPTPYHASSVEEWWARTATLAGPLAQRLAALPEHAQQALLAHARAASSTYATPDGLEIPGVSLVAAATRS
jgi:SAM-dependent methyltransferase